ncbi:MAG: GGDEF domain-containing protein [Acidobacteriota bacterium]
MISLKRYLAAAPSAEVGGLLASVLDAYRSTLTAVGVSATHACPPVSQDLERRLTDLGRELAESVDAGAVADANARVEGELHAWGHEAQTYLAQKTDDVKELLVVLARTAATIGASDSRYTKRFEEFTARLKGIASLQDLTHIRTSLVASATELKFCVEEMSRDTRQSVAQLQAEVVTYQAKLEAAEQLASRDSLTGLFNRGRVIAHLEQRIACALAFSVAIVDLDGFKHVNDHFGHATGDDLLKQFSTELQSNARPGDVVGRWGGDEFVVVLGCGRSDAQQYVDRIEKWVFGNYTIESAAGPRKVQVHGSIGLEEWKPGETVAEVVERADAAMYQRKAATDR